MAAKGWSHAKITSEQFKLAHEFLKSGRPNTMAEQSRIAYEALVRGGVPTAEARALVDLSAQHLRGMGVTAPVHKMFDKAK
jgi:hypothetical protein